MWVVFNEGWGQYDTERLRRAGQGSSTRPAWSTTPAAGPTRRWATCIDMHSYPGPAAPSRRRTGPACWASSAAWAWASTATPGRRRPGATAAWPSAEELTRRYERAAAQGVWELQGRQGLSAAVYTQTTDVETECNGLLTYDRAVIKVDRRRLAAANRGRAAAAIRRVVVPTSQEQGASTWRYTIEQAGRRLVSSPTSTTRRGRKAPAASARESTPGAVVRTEWKTGDIWLRRDVRAARDDSERPALLVHHDEDAEIYINGVLAAKAGGYTTDYEELAHARRRPRRAASRARTSSPSTAARPAAGSTSTWAW